MPFVRSPYNYDRRAAGRASAVYCEADEDMAKQEFKEESDINTILRRFNVTGQLPQNVRQPTYGDFTGITNFQDALEAINMARDAFMQMPAEIRRRFDNDPGSFVDFFEDPRNEAEARRLGLVRPEAVVVQPSGVASSGEAGGGEGSAAPQGGTLPT